MEEAGLWSLPGEATLGLSLPSGQATWSLESLCVWGGWTGTRGLTDMGPSRGSSGRGLAEWWQWLLNTEAWAQAQEGGEAGACSQRGEALPLAVVG